jgi:hypothetical protein
VGAECCAAAALRCCNTALLLLLARAATAARPFAAVLLPAASTIVALLSCALHAPRASLLPSGLLLCACREGGKTVTLEAPLGDIPLHMLGGTVSSRGSGAGSNIFSSKGSCICCGCAPAASSPRI